jgi:chorismate-pyruvate lyase
VNRCRGDIGMTAGRGDAAPRRSSARTGSHCVARLVSLLQEPTRLATEILEELCGAPVTAEIRRRAVGTLPRPLQTSGRGSVEDEWDHVLPPERVLELMQISTACSVQFRAVHLRAGVADVATASAIVALDRISSDERTVLNTTSTPLGPALARSGVQRVMVTSLELPDVDPTERTSGDPNAPVLTVIALLCRGTVPVGLVRENFLRRLLDRETRPHA